MKLSLLALAVMASGASTLVAAAPVSQWSFSTNATFTGSTFQSGGAGTTTQLPSELSWGASGGNFQINTGDASNNRSALTIGTSSSLTGGGPATGTVNTTMGGSPSIGLGQVGTGISVTHWNNPISSAFNTLLSGQVTDVLRLTPLLPAEYAGRPYVDAPTIIFNFNFQETPNGGGVGGLCADGLPASSYANGCPDLFGFNATTLNNAFQYLDPGSDGTFGTGDDFFRTYFASVFVFDDQNGASPLKQLSNGECAAIGLSNGCLGFRTLEATHTTALFGFAVTTEPIQIPEPGSLALLGLALGAAGLARRQREN